MQDSSCIGFIEVQTSISSPRCTRGRTGRHGHAGLHSVPTGSRPALVPWLVPPRQRGRSPVRPKLVVAQHHDYRFALKCSKRLHSATNAVAAVASNLPWYGWWGAGQFPPTPEPTLKYPPWQSTIPFSHYPFFCQPRPMPGPGVVMPTSSSPASRSKD